MKQKFNVSYSVAVDPDELFENFKRDCDILDCDETDIRDYVMETLEDDDKLRLLNEGDKERIIQEVINLYHNEKPDVPIEVLNARVEVLKAMNEYILDIIGDDDITDFWFRDGVPDGADDNDLEEIAKNSLNWYDIVTTFWRCIHDET